MRGQRGVVLALSARERLTLIAFLEMAEPSSDPAVRRVLDAVRKKLEL